MKGHRRWANARCRGWANWERPGFDWLAERHTAQLGRKENKEHEKSGTANGAVYGARTRSCLKRSAHDTSAYAQFDSKTDTYSPFPFTCKRATIIVKMKACFFTLAEMGGSLPKWESRGGLPETTSQPAFWTKGKDCVIRSVEFQRECCLSKSCHIGCSCTPWEISTQKKTGCEKK